MSQSTHNIASADTHPKPTTYVLLAPGQGAQKPGMFTPWLELPGVEARLSTWSKICGIDLLRLGTSAEATELVDTAITQPLVVAAALLAYQEIEDTSAIGPHTVVAGHSVGELAAAAVAGVITTEEAISLAAIRGQAMAIACEKHRTGMAAVLGGDPGVVLDAIAEFGLTAANLNAAGQIVAAGPTDALAAIAADAPDGAKVVRLPVAGAFHTTYMEPAREIFATAVSEITPEDPKRPLLSNADGQPVTSGTEALTKIVSQITRPVRWDLCLETLRAHHITAAIELPPAGTLTGIVRRELIDVARHPLRTPADLLDLNTLAMPTRS